MVFSIQSTQLFVFEIIFLFVWRELSKIIFWGVQVTTPYTDLKGEKSKISWVIWKCVVWKSQQQQQQQKMGKTSATEAALRPLYTLFYVYLHFLITPFYTFSDWLKFLVFKIDKTTWRIWSFEKELFSSFYKHFLDFLSIDESYCYLKTCRKVFLMTSLMRNY